MSVGDFTGVAVLLESCGFFWDAPLHSKIIPTQQDKIGAVAQKKACKEAAETKSCNEGVLHSVMENTKNCRTHCF